MKNTQIIILAAGKGTRMESDEPKALTMLRGKSFISRLLYTLEQLKLEYKPIIIVGYKKDRIIEALGPDQRYVEQVEQLGTGHAVLSAYEMSQENSPKTIIVLYADHPLVTAETIQRLVNKQQETRVKIVMAPTMVTDFLGWRDSFFKWGRIKRNTNGEIISIVEYKDATDAEKEITGVNPGYFAFDAGWVWEKLRSLKNNNASGEYYLTELIQLAFDEGEKIESVVIRPEEAVGANSKSELLVLERILDGDMLKS